MKILARLGLSWDSKFFSSIRQSKRKKKKERNGMKIISKTQKDS